MTFRRRSILIVGAGIAGLTAARALLRDGHHVRLVEQAPVFEPVGAGIVMAGNALAALDSIGIGAAMRAAGRVALNGGIYHSDGTPLITLDQEELHDRPLLLDNATFYRPDLHEVLTESVVGVELHLGAQPTSIAEKTNGVVVTLDDGWEGKVDLVVGADGIHSYVRTNALGTEGPRAVYAGYTCWRVVGENKVNATAVTETWGRGLRVGLVPLSSNRIYSFLVANEERGLEDDPGVPRHETLKRRFESFAGPAGDFVASLDGDFVVMRHDIEDLERIVWGSGRQVLIGDAAHALTPNMGQGAAQGIESAIALALVLREVDADDEIVSALRASRDNRVGKVKGRSKMLGEIGQWENPVACWFRNTATHFSPHGPSLDAMEDMLKPGAQLAARLTAGFIAS